MNRNCKVGKVPLKLLDDGWYIRNHNVAVLLLIIIIVVVVVGGGGGSYTLIYEYIGW